MLVFVLVFSRLFNKKACKMKIFTFSRIRNVEFGHLYLRSIDVVKRHDPVALHVEAEYEKARASVELCDHLMVKSRKMPLTAQQRKAQAVLLESVAMLMKKMRLIKQEPGVEHPAEFDELFDLFDTHLTDIRSRKIYGQVRLLEGFVDALEGEADYMELVNELNLSVQYEAMKSDLESLTDVFDMRQQVKANREKARALNARRKLNSLLRQLYLEIESASKIHKDVEYSTLIKELNAEIALSVTRNRSNNQGKNAPNKEGQHVA